MNITITVEGPPGAGKSALITLLARLLEELECELVVSEYSNSYDQDRASWILSSIGPTVTITERQNHR